MRRIGWDEQGNGCWLWRGARNSAGYGQIRFGGEAMYAHRIVANALADQVVMHSCDTPACVRPSHLILGTMRENTADMMRKGRARFGGVQQPAR